MHVFSSISIFIDLFFATGSPRLLFALLPAPLKRVRHPARLLSQVKSDARMLLSFSAVYGNVSISAD
jgi:hypothetical protein